MTLERQFMACCGCWQRLDWDNHRTLIPALFSPQIPSYQRLSSVWERDSLDWKDLSAEDIYKRVTSKVSPGSIILFHNAGKNTPEALPQIIEYLLSEGYEIVPVSQLLLTGEYDIDNTGRMTPRQVS